MDRETDRRWDNFMKVPGWDCKDGTPDEDHDWKLMHDSYGADDVINGTADMYWYECEQCGKEKEWDGEYPSSYDEDYF